MELALTLSFDDAVLAFVDDCHEQDLRFYAISKQVQATYQEAKMYWAFGKVRTLEYCLTIPSVKGRTAAFKEAAADGLGIKPRRLYEAQERYRLVYKKGDSLKETVERAKQEYRVYSNIGAPQEAEVEPPDHNHLYICKCGEIYHP